MERVRFAAFGERWSVGLKSTERRREQARNRAQRGARTAAVDSTGLPAREAAVELVSAVLFDGRTLDDALDKASRGLDPRDRGFARLIAATVLRRRGELDHVLGLHLRKPLGAKLNRVTAILLSGAAQLLYLGTPAHAAIHSAVQQSRGHCSSQSFDKLVNAVLRRVAEDGAHRSFPELDPLVAMPPWLSVRLCAAYGNEVAGRVVRASLQEAPLDLSVKSDGPGWATRLGGKLLPTGSVRLTEPGRIDHLDGYAEGDWWVQDAAAALPVKMLGEPAGRTVADLCAAPGGKSAQLAALGARVTAVDGSGARLRRLAANVERLRLDIEIIEADVRAWQPRRQFDAVLLDAPCSSTGTIRRHPDILHIKRGSDLAPLMALQDSLLRSAGQLVAPGGTLVYCTCSLLPEEGEMRVAAFLAGVPEFSRVPIRSEDLSVPAPCVTSAGDLRTLPFHFADAGIDDGGLDGFYAAKLTRAA